MLFHTWQFFVFFTLIFVMYRNLGLRRQNQLLLIASYFFYGSWNYKLLVLIIISTLVDFYAAQKIAATGTPATKKRWLMFSIGTNLSLLGFFKYFNFFTDGASALFGLFGFHLTPLELSIVLPVGISFYTFQTMSYTIDVYKGALTPTRNLRDFALFVSFFPQLIAGPIERALHLLPQIQRSRKITAQDIAAGLWLFIYGLWLKVFIADHLALAVDPIFAGDPLNATQAWLGALAFTGQIYADFAGYTSMARGLGHLLGFKLTQNFKHPLLTRNIQDFWQRWHITLSNWFKDYVYIPLGGNRQGTATTLRNLLITMGAVGLWHGANVTFVLWGLLQGLALILHRWWRATVQPKRPAVFLNGLSWGITFLFTAASFALFRSPSIQYAQNYILTLLSFNFGPAESRLWLIVISNGLLLVVAELVTRRWPHVSQVMRWPLYLQTTTIYCLLYLTIFYGSDTKEFLYFAF